MKLTVGMGTISSYERMVEAGASEVFMGYVPYAWNKKYGNVLPLNRREVFYYHIQTTNLEDMKILKAMKEKYQVPVVVTFNALYYTEEQLDDILQIMQELIPLGFDEFIISDVNLIRFLFENEVPCKIHVSGELGEWNSETIRFLYAAFPAGKTRIKRLIFHRKLTMKQMESMIQTGKSLDPSLEYEAFLMNEKCHYTGGFCNSMHCDEMVHLCQIPYELRPVYEEDANESEKEEEDLDGEMDAEEVPGNSGCGLCAISKLKKIGITHAKIVGRGLPEDVMRSTIQFVKNASGLQRKEEILKLFPNGKCSKNCYYLTEEIDSE